MICENLTLHRARGFLGRLLGLHALDGLAWHTGLWLTPCNAVHTFGLPYFIDVVFLDGGGQVLKQMQNVGPNRIAWHFTARSVVEFPAGYCAREPGYAQALGPAMRRAVRSGSSVL